jgi:O-6-methylguanine DNA methyltransferase
MRHWFAKRSTATMNAMTRDGSAAALRFGYPKTLALPATAQEVGGACAANVLAVAIPCHRVVKADGSISGYRWGVHCKRRLLKMEGVA